MVESGGKLQMRIEWVAAIQSVGSQELGVGTQKCEVGCQLCGVRGVETEGVWGGVRRGDWLESDAAPSS